MPRAGNSKYRIYQAANELVAKGIRPTVRAVREALDGGSYTLITEHLRTWRDRHLHVPDEEQSPDNAVEAAISRLYDALVTEADQKLEGRAAKLDEQIATTDKLLTQADEKITSLLDLVDSLQEQNDKLLSEQKELKAQVLLERKNTEIAIQAGEKLRSELDIETRTTSGMSGELNEKAKHLRTLQEENIRLSKTLTKLENDKQAEVKQLSIQLEAVENQLRNSHKTGEQLKVKVAELETLQSSTDDKLKNASRGIAIQEKTNEQLLVKLQAAEQYNDKLNTDLERIRQISIVAQDEAMKSLLDKMNSLEKKIHDNQSKR